ncbi:10410_t:CDS:2, partial [Cetraspora pellucida]
VIWYKQMNSESHDTDNRNHTSLQPSTVTSSSNSMATGPGHQRSSLTGTADPHSTDTAKHVTQNTEGKQIIETLLYKPNISAKLWKAIAFGSYVNLQEFLYKNLLASMKENDDEPVLQSTKGEQELNNYRDHVNELCLKQNFYAIMSYDEDRKVTLVTNQDTTLSDYNTEVKGRNFDATTIKRQRHNTYQLIRFDTEWFDDREICIN